MTAELAAALPALVLFTAVALGAVDAVTKKLECVDAARDAALAAARGDDGTRVGLAHAPEGAQVTVTIRDGTVRATVALSVHPMGEHGPAFTVTAAATAALEGQLP